MKELITIKSSNISTDIAVAKTYLESKGIPCFTKDELLNQVHPFAIGGVKLQVSEDDALRAAECLIEGGFARREDFEVPESTLRMVRIYEKISEFFRKKK